MTDEATPTPPTDSPDDPGTPEELPAPAELDDSDEIDDPEGRPLSPLGAFAETHRFVIGLSIAAVMVAVGAWAALTFVPENPIPGAFGVIQRYAFPVMCALIAVVGTTWALRLKRVWTNAAAYAAISTYLIYVLTGWIYEQFVA